MPLADSNPIDLLKMITNPADATSTALQGFDPSSPEIVKTIASTIARLQAGGAAPDEETARNMGVALKAHTDYKTAEKNLQDLIKSYATPGTTTK